MFRRLVIYIFTYFSSASWHLAHLGEPDSQQWVLFGVVSPAILLVALVLGLIQLLRRLQNIHMQGIRSQERDVWTKRP